MITSPYPFPWPGGHIPDGCETRLDRAVYRDGIFAGETSYGFRSDEDAQRAAEADAGCKLHWTTQANPGGLVFTYSEPVQVGDETVSFTIADPWNGDPH